MRGEGGRRRKGKKGWGHRKGGRVEEEGNEGEQEKMIQ